MAAAWCVVVVGSGEKEDERETVFAVVNNINV